MPYLGTGAPLAPVPFSPLLSFRCCKLEARVSAIKKAAPVRNCLFPVPGEDGTPLSH